MGLRDEGIRAKDGNDLDSCIKKWQTGINRLQSLVGELDALIVKYPADAAEINGYKDTAKTQLLNFYNSI